MDLNLAIEITDPDPGGQSITDPPDLDSDPDPQHCQETLSYLTFKKEWQITEQLLGLDFC
jgi:hypothetical protein